MYMTNWSKPEFIIPKVVWKDGYYYPRLLILLREIQITPEDKHLTLSIGEYDTTGSPPVWRTWDEHLDKDGIVDCNGKIVTDVVGWIYAPRLDIIAAKPQ